MSVETLIEEGRPREPVTTYEEAHSTSNLVLIPFDALTYPIDSEAIVARKEPPVDSSEATQLASVRKGLIAQAVSSGADLYLRVAPYKEVGGSEEDAWAYVARVKEKGLYRAAKDWQKDHDVPNVPPFVYLGLAPVTLGIYAAGERLQQKAEEMNTRKNDGSVSWLQKFTAKEMERAGKVLTDTGRVLIAVMCVGGGGSSSSGGEDSSSDESDSSSQTSSYPQEPESSIPGWVTGKGSQPPWMPTRPTGGETAQYEFERDEEDPKDWPINDKGEDEYGNKFY